MALNYCPYAHLAALPVIGGATSLSGYASACIRKTIIKARRRFIPV